MVVRALLALPACSFRLDELAWYRWPLLFFPLPRLLDGEPGFSLAMRILALVPPRAVRISERGAQDLFDRVLGLLLCIFVLDQNG